MLVVWFVKWLRFVLARLDEMEVFYEFLLSIVTCNMFVLMYSVYSIVQWHTVVQYMYSTVEHGSTRLINLQRLGAVLRRYRVL